MTKESHAEIIELTKNKAIEVIGEITEGIAEIDANMSETDKVDENMEEVGRIAIEYQEGLEISDTVQNSVVNVEPVNFGSRQSLVDFDVKTPISPLKFLNLEGTETTIRSLK